MDKAKEGNGQMDKTEFEAKFQDLFKVLGDFLDGYEEANLEWGKITLFQLAYDATLFLKTRIEDPEEKEITWSNPFVELQYPVEMDWEKLSPLAFTLTDKDLLDVMKISQIMTEGFLHTKSLFIFRALCNDTALLKEGDSHTILLSKDHIEYLNRLPEKKRQKAFKKIEAQAFDNPLTLPFVSKRQVTDPKGRKRKLEALLFLRFEPLILDKDVKRAYYPVLVGLRFKGYKPIGWPEQDRQDFWNTFLSEIEALIPKEIIPKPETLAKAEEAIPFTLTPGAETVATPQLPIPIPRPITEPLHRQPRGYLKTSASLVAREKDPQQLSLHFPLALTRSEDIPEIKKTISRDIAITGNYLIQLWQNRKNKDGVLVIDNLTEIANYLNTTAQRFKEYLIFLAGFQYPVIRSREEKKEIAIAFEKLAKINFVYDEKKYSERMNREDLKIGTRYLSFIKDTPVKAVEFMPTDTTMNEIEKKDGFGHILVSDSFVAFCLGLSDMAYKLLCFTGSNRPRGYRIGFDKLIRQEYLNLERQVGTQGKPRVINAIIKAVEELKEKGHLLPRSGYDPRKDEFRLEYTDMIFKHPDFKKVDETRPKT